MSHAHYPLTHITVTPLPIPAEDHCNLDPSTKIDFKLPPPKINLQTEFAEFVHGTKAALVAFDSSPKGDLDQFKFWDASNYAREQYRALTNTTFTGEMAEVRGELDV